MLTAYLVPLCEFFWEFSIFHFCRPLFDIYWHLLSSSLVIYARAFSTKTVVTIGRGFFFLLSAQANYKGKDYQRIVAFKLKIYKKITSAECMLQINPLLVSNKRIAKIAEEDQSWKVVYNRLKRSSKKLCSSFQINISNFFTMISWSSNLSWLIFNWNFLCFYSVPAETGYFTWSLVSRLNDLTLGIWRHFPNTCTRNQR